MVEAAAAGKALDKSSTQKTPGIAVSASARPRQQRTHRTARKGCQSADQNTYRDGYKRRQQAERQTYARAEQDVAEHVAAETVRAPEVQAHPVSGVVYTEQTQRRARFDAPPRPQRLRNQAERKRRVPFSHAGRGDGAADENLRGIELRFILEPDLLEGLHIERALESVDIRSYELPVAKDAHSVGRLKRQVRSFGPFRIRGEKVGGGGEEVEKPQHGEGYAKPWSRPAASENHHLNVATVASTLF